jgi:hypothetical protein
MEDAIELEYQVTLEDYLEANKAVIKNNFSKPWISWGILKLLPASIAISGLSFILFSVLLLVNFNDDYINHLLSNWFGIKKLYTFDEITLLIFGCLLVVLAIVFILFFTSEFVCKFKSKQWENSWQNNLNVAEIRKITIDNTGLNLESDAFNITCQWAAITRFIESESVFVLYLFTGERKIVPKRIFINEDTINKFRDLLE